jgi:hypothetical protein
VALVSRSNFLERINKSMEIFELTMEVGAPVSATDTFTGAATSLAVKVAYTR